MTKNAITFADLHRDMRKPGEVGPVEPPGLAPFPFNGERAGASGEMAGPRAKENRTSEPRWFKARWFRSRFERGLETSHSSHSIPLPVEGRGRPQGASRASRAFTLIELILVLVLLATVIAISAPSLSRFFRSRGLESEARRFLALTRHAQSRAVSEGVPMVLWLDTKQRAYGLNADKTFVEADPKSEQFTVDETLQVETQFSPDAQTAGQASQFKNEKQTTSGLCTFRFNPDGFVSASSPEAVGFRQKDNGELWIAQSRNRLNYEIQVGKAIASR